MTEDKKQLDPKTEYQVLVMSSYISDRIFEDVHRRNISTIFKVSDLENACGLSGGFENNRNIHNEVINSLLNRGFYVEFVNSDGRISEKIECLLYDDAFISAINVMYYHFTGYMRDGASERKMASRA